MTLPTGTVTFLFTDIEGSTKLWEEFPEAMKAALSKHDSILKEAVESNHGQIFKTTGDGVHAVFTTAMDALNAAVEAQRKLNSLILNYREASPRDELQITSPQSPVSSLFLRARMGLHTGEAELRDGDRVRRASRLQRTAEPVSGIDPSLLSTERRENRHDRCPCFPVVCLDPQLVCENRLMFRTYRIADQELNVGVVPLHLTRQPRRREVCRCGPAALPHHCRGIPFAPQCMLQCQYAEQAGVHGDDHHAVKRHRYASIVSIVGPGVLLASGYIAGGALAGIAIALAVEFLTGTTRAFGDWSKANNPFYEGPLADFLSLLPFAALAVLLYLVGREIVLAAARRKIE